MHNRASLGLAIVIMVLAGWGTLSALAWPWKAKLFPLVIGIPLFCLAAAEALWIIFGSRGAHQAAATSPAISAVVAGPPPLNGTCSRSIPARCFSISITR